MAAKTIKQRIALDGGKEILATLQGMGKEGEAAFKKIEVATKAATGPGVKLSASIANLRSKFGALEKAAGRVRDRFGGMRDAGGRLGTSLSNVGRNAGLLTAAIGATVAGLVAFTKGGTEAADAADKQAAALGLTIDEYGRLQFAFEQGGVDAEKFAGAMTRLNVKLGELKEGNKNAAETFKALGVRALDAGGNARSAEVIFGEIANKFASMPDGAKKSALAVELFGRTGAALIPTLNDGAAALRGLGEEAEQLGLVFTEQQAATSVAFNDSLNRLKRSALGLRNQLSILFAPFLTEASDGLVAAIGRNKDAIVDLANNAISKAIPIAEDFLAVLTGRDADVKNSWVLELKAQVIQFAEAVQNAISGVIIPAFDALKLAGEGVAATFNGIFGTDFSGQEILIGAALLKLSGILGVVTSAAGFVLGAIRLLVAGFGLIAPAIAFFGSLGPVILAGVQAVGAAIAGLISIPALIVAAVIAAVAAVVIYWDEVKAAAAVAFEFLVAGASLIGGAFSSAFGALTFAASAAWSLIVEGASAAFNGVLALAETIGAGALAAFSALGSAASNIWQAIYEAAAAAFRAVVGAASSLGSSVASSFRAILDAAVAVWRAIYQAVATVWRAVSEVVAGGLTGAFSVVRDMALGIWSAFRDAGSAAVDFISRQVGRLVSALRSARDLFRSSSSGSGSSGSSGAGLPGFSTGGRVRGPGSGVSDSILARLSNGEFVVKARAVRHYGVGLLEAINGGRLPRLPGFATGGHVTSERGASLARLGDAFARLPAFAAGGLVKVAAFDPAAVFGGLAHGLTGGLAPVPAYASGGLVDRAPATGGRPVNLTLDGQSFNMVAEADVAEKLARHASRQRVASVGRLPSWRGA